MSAFACDPLTSRDTADSNRVWLRLPAGLFVVVSAICLKRNTVFVSSSILVALSQDFDAAATYAHLGISAHRACMSGLLPYYTPWAKHLAIAGKVIVRSLYAVL